MAGEGNSPIWGAIIQGASQVGGGLLSMIGQKNRERRAMANTKDLMEIQQKNQMELDRLGQQIQLDTWEKTNYPSQVKMLKEAGLNPALLYGHGGGGGATTGSQGGGSAASGNAPAPQQMPYMDLGTSLAKAAEIALVKAEARKANAEADNIEKYGGEKAKSDIDLNKANTLYTNVKSDVEQINKVYRPYQITAEVNNVIEQTNKLKLENALTKEQFDDIVTTTKNNAVNSSIRNTLDNARIKLTNAEIDEIGQSIQQKWAEIRQKDVQLSQTDKQIGQKQREISQKDSDIIIEKFKADTARKFPGIMNVAGGIVQGALNQLENIGRQLNSWVFDISKDEVNPYQK